MGTASAIEALAACAACLRPRARLEKPRGGDLPRLWFFTDPARIADPLAIARRLPAGAGIVFRAFGAPEAVDQGRALAAIAASRDLVLLAGADADLALAIGAAGVHLPQRLADQAQPLRAAHPGWRITAAAHDAAAIDRAAAAGAEALFVSPVFASASPSAGTPLGPDAFARLVALSPVPVMALGGVTPTTAPLLADTGAAGLAAVEAFLQD
ncbi:MAG: thiamine phosphate synthase [Caulobacter sp.]